MALLVLAGVSWLLLQDGHEATETGRSVARTHAVIGEINYVFSNLADAESAQRGYLITGDDSYLEPYARAISDIELGSLRLIELTADTPEHQARAIELKRVADDRVAIIAEGLRLRRERGFESAQRFLVEGAGRRQMDKVRLLAGELAGIETELLKQRTEASKASTDRTKFTFAVGSLTSLLLLTAVFLMLNQQIRVRVRTEEALTAALEKERVLLNSAVDVICTVNTEGSFSSMNPACKKMWGYSPEEMIGRPYVDFIVPEDIDKSNEAAVRIMAGETETDFENRYVHKNGSHVHVNWSATWSESEQMMFCVAHDISERKAAEEKLQKFALELERSNSELQDFAAVASHDLQEPLRKIQSFADELKMNLADSIGEDDLDTLERMMAAAGRMRTLINDLLSFSRVTTQAKPFEPVDLNSLVNEVLSDLEARTQDTGGRIEVGPLPTIDADPMQMRQLLQNLIGNGLKFHRPGVPPVIQISCLNGGPNCRLTITDNGIGFDEKYLDRIFTVFQRLHGRNEYEGTGIGLAICRKIVERHRGEITASSVPGEGSRFSVKLPTKQTTEESQ